MPVIFLLWFLIFEPQNEIVFTPIQADPNVRWHLPK